MPAQDADWDSWPYEITWRIESWPAEAYKTFIDISVSCDSKPYCLLGGGGSSVCAN